VADLLDLYNATLTELGQEILSAVTEDTPRQRALSAQWDRVRRAELRRHGWKCALARRAIAADATAPAFGWSYAYSVPSDFLRAWRIGELPDFRIKYALEGRKLLTDESAPLYLQYVKDLETVSEFDALLFDALVYRLAHACCFKITEKLDLRDELRKEYQKRIAEARTTSAMESFYDELYVSDLEESRL